jgi:phosphoglycolate phosphatase
MKQTIIWDFNGTLLNDMQVCIDCMNVLLADRGLSHLGLDRYREIFTFPVRQYYQELGFDFTREPFDIPAHQFIDLYRKSLKDAPLHPETVDLLIYFHDKGFRQIILSAMEQQFLEETLEQKKITGYFDQIYGIQDHLGDGKLEMAREILREHENRRNYYILIGDTIHDFDVAQELDIKCILVATGHQSYERLNSLDCIVLEKLDGLRSAIPEWSAGAQ